MTLCVFHGNAYSFPHFSKAVNHIMDERVMRELSPTMQAPQEIR